MKAYAIIIGVTVVAIIALWFVNARVTKAPNSIVCSMAAKLCPDGSTVTRSGPICEFAVCPALSSTSTPGVGTGSVGILPYDSGVRGTVMLGPTCPVERVPPDPLCADKPYETTILIYRPDSMHLFATAQSNAKGAFEVSLPPGSYRVSALGGKILPHCGNTDVTVGPSEYVQIAISCDMGIR